MKSEKLSSLSLFYPAYNEAGNIEEAVKQALHVLPTIAKKFEIIVINDGSTDATLSIAQRLASQYISVRVISQRNKGYGGALKRGFKEAKYEWIFFSDSDLQFDLGELQKFISATDESNLIIGYRIKRAEGIQRDMLARALKLWNWMLLGFPRSIKDIDCAFKLIHKSVLKQIGTLYSDGAMVSTELLLKAHKAGIKPVQIGVQHYNRYVGSPTGSNHSVIVKAVHDTFFLRKELLHRKYLNAIKVSRRFATNISQLIVSIG